MKIVKFIRTIQKPKKLTYHNCDICCYTSKILRCVLKKNFRICLQLQNMQKH